MSGPIQPKNIVWKEHFDKNTNWLLNSTPYTRYRTLTDLMEYNRDDQMVRVARLNILQDSGVKNLLNELLPWFDKSSKQYDDAAMPHYKLRMLADFGLTVSDPGIAEIVEEIKKHRRDGMFAIRQYLPDRQIAKSEEWLAFPCDSTLLTYTLLALKVDDEELSYTIDRLKKHWIVTDGWFCNLFFVNSQYKKLRIGCPMAGLMTLEVFSELTNFQQSEIVRNAFEPLKVHRDMGTSLYFFGRSKRFWSFKYPFVWYNAFYMADVLSRFEIFKKDPLFTEIIDWIENSFDNKGKIMATSMFRTYNDWEFANKKNPSPWLTFLAYRILKRYYSQYEI